ncbi:tigger transposable element-derived protein 3 [Anolis carolinensis]|uniref:C2H2-type domain-containing protein n=1 Tax=Anolis carolinensis TaxID=28377 RepID=H9GVQ6_ANOCA|nr:PREDICTED: tigger transposable element-derived protein 3-like [Anolis carolinensis]|eukprot:XP_008120136.1 PREDICTED: tigger transposable element-derived protein 3-like [Anolis carolinensis]
MSPKGKAQGESGSGEDQPPKGMKEEGDGDGEGCLELRPKTGKSRGNGLLRQGDGAQRMGCKAGPGPRGPPSFGVCRIPPAEAVPHWCLDCGRNFGQRSELEKHASHHHAGRHSYICGDCGRSFVDRVSLAGRAPGPSALHHSGCRRRVLPSESAVPRKERKELSLQEKVRVLEMLEGPKVSQSELAKRFGVSQPQICRIIKNKERILAEWGKNGDPGRKRKMEERLPHGSDGATQCFGGPVNGLRLQEKARRLSDAVGRLPLSWANGSKAKPKANRRPDTEVTEEEHWENTEKQKSEHNWKNTVLSDILRKYDSSEIYACAEVTVLLRAMPRMESAKDRLTVLLCANMDSSDKRDPLVVGKAPRPPGVPQELPPATYRADGQARMTAALFAEWLWTFNEEAKAGQRHVALFVTPCAAHPAVELSNVRMVFVPRHENHPLELGTSRVFRCHYRRRMLTRLVVALGGQTSGSRGHVALSDAIHLSIQAWSEVSPETVRGGFQAAGFIPNPGVFPTPSTQVVRALGFQSQEQFGQFISADEGSGCFGDEGGSEGQGLGAEEEEEEKADESASPPCPSQAEVVESLAKLRRCFECHSASPEMFQAFYKLEDVVHGMFLTQMHTLTGKAPNQD